MKNELKIEITERHLYAHGAYRFIDFTANKLAYHAVMSAGKPQFVVALFRVHGRAVLANAQVGGWTTRPEFKSISMNSDRGQKLAAAVNKIVAAEQQQPNSSLGY